MNDLRELLDLSRATAIAAGERLAQSGDLNLSTYRHSETLPREIKAVADEVLELDILRALRPTGLPILSEESGVISGSRPSSQRFIVDPLDGTFNFVKGLGPSAVSIALWDSERSVFGVIYSLMDRRLFWGGPGLGAHCDDRPISVSGTSIRDRAAICTGFPARLDLETQTSANRLWKLGRNYGKVRMIGSAAIALTHVARGSADVYAEQNIMIWDVAAGIALVEGAGGRVRIEPGTAEHSYDVFASNQKLFG